MWSLSSSKGEITKQTDKQVWVTITTGRSGKLELKYRENEEDVILDITIESL